MADDTATLPATAPLPNVVLPSGFQAAAQTAVAMARSPLDRALETPSTIQPPPGAPPQAQADSLAQAQARDRGQTPSSGASSSSDTSPQGDKPMIDFHRPSARQITREKDWNRLNSELATARLELQQLRAGAPVTPQPGAPSSTPQPLDVASLKLDDLISKHADVQALKRERDTYYEEIKHVRVEADPEFKAKFDSRRDAAIGIAKRSAGGAADDIGRILAMSDGEARRAALAERLTTGNFSDTSKTKIAAAVASLDALDVEREMEIASRKATWEHTAAQRRAQADMQVQQRLAKLDNDFNAELAEWADPDKGMPFLFNDKERLISVAKNVFNGEMTGRQLAKAALQSAVLPEVIRVAQRMGEEIENLKTQLTRYTGAYPADSGFAGATTSSQPGPRSAADLTAPGYVQQFVSGLEAARAQDVRGR